MKRLWILLIGLLLLLTACGTKRSSDKPAVVAAIFPEYDWARQIMAGTDALDLRLLMDDGVDPHSYQPTVADIVTVKDAALLIYGGGESDEWLADAIREDQPALALLPLLGDDAHTAELSEGMVSREDEDEVDEHVWLSVRNAKRFCHEIAKSLCSIDPDNAAHYMENYASYAQKLDALDEAYIQTVSNGRTDTILVCDRFPLRYLVEDYGLRYYAAFPGCSAESGASFQTILFLSDKVRELELNTVLTMEGNDGRLARTVAENSGRSVRMLAMDSMQSVSARDAADRDYLSIMEQNRQALEAALR